MARKFIFNPSTGNMNISDTTGGGGGGGAVDSVNGATGVVVLDQDDILDGATYKQYSQTEKTKLAGIESGAQVNTVTSVASKTGAVALVKADVGLSNVDNTSDANKPVSTATQTALNLKANLASPTFTGTVAGITAAMVGAPAGSGTSTGINTGDQNLAPYATTAAVAAGYQPLSAVLTATTASFTTADETKLDGIAAGATVNSPDATLLARANHTGTQPLSTISDAGSIASKSGAGFNTITVGTTAPSSPTAGDIWIDTN